MTLEKARLLSLDGNEYNIDFMFNPTQLDFSRSIRLNSNPGARNTHGQPKVSFANPEPCVLNLSKIIFDVYERGDAGATELEDYIKQLTKAVQFIQGSSGGRSGGSSGSGGAGGNNANARPPIFFFIWGSKCYLRCFIESFRYQLTMFLPNGKPVRATASLVLKEADETIAAGSTQLPPNVNRFADTRESRTRR
jgi:Contractile injection system tube protein